MGSHISFVYLFIAEILNNQLDFVLFLRNLFILFANINQKPSAWVPVPCELDSAEKRQKKPVGLGIIEMSISPIT